MLQDSTKGLILIAEQDGRVVGFACIRTVADEAEILNLAVLPGMRRQGVGRALLQQALRKAWENGARRAFLEVRQSNRPARKLYESLGFSPNGLRTAYYSNPPEDAVVLACSLVPPK
jgi:ribosomal-protein-alanine N-acetyltransferase